MRVVEQKMLKAIRHRKNFKDGNTEVIQYDTIAKVFLHSHCICVHNYVTNERKYSDCGWQSHTTKSRLNALGADIYQKDWCWYNADGSVWQNQI